MTNMKPFHYSKLSASASEIRLLRILPGDPGSPIRAKLYTFRLLPSLKGCPRFAAISYTSSAPKQPPIPVQTNDALLPVHPTVHELLITLRDSRAQFPQQPHFVWIDDVCINQEDADERNGRGKLMRTVYSSAVTVMVWLGAAANGSDEAMEYLGGLKREEQAATKGLESGGKREVLFADGDLGGAFQGGIGNKVVALLSREAWGRMGIVNEVLLARRLLLLCGSKRVGWKRLSSFFGAVESHLAQSPRRVGELGCGIRAMMTQAYRLVMARGYLSAEAVNPAEKELPCMQLLDVFCSESSYEIDVGDLGAALEVYNDLAAYFMSRILDELKTLMEQSSVVTLRVRDSVGRSVDNTEAEITRFETILQRIDTLETDFDRISQIRNIVRRLGSCTEELEESLDVGEAQ
ncbi:heterokaryon incompatibility protein-domain-containing protein [Cercophora newfieldiana]|uniref:Heterokaryon incompatibility protein-domain-containing protein n=1 Tax=Cercophora newfieldiana TaxID=92897 RepID=A0AA39XZP8_9PEZI|nr:heterokaryon incompatibility protein-domain-containing protein [Cercophora newfieldiana]